LYTAHGSTGQDDLIKYVRERVQAEVNMGGGHILQQLLATITTDECVTQCAFNLLQHYGSHQTMELLPRRAMDICL
jgi:hypothetical protein